MTITPERLREILANPILATTDDVDAMFAELKAARITRERHLTDMAAVAQAHLDAVADRDRLRATLRLLDRIVVGGEPGTGTEPEEIQQVVEVVVRLRAELDRINAAMAEVDECPSGELGVHHLRAVIRSMAEIATQCNRELAEAKAQLAATQSELESLRDGWLDVTGKPNSWPAGPDGDLMAQEWVRAQLAARQEPSDAEIEAWRAKAESEPEPPWGFYVRKEEIEAAVALLRLARPDDGKLVMSKREAEELMRCYRILDQVHSGRGPSNTYIGSILESTRAALAAHKAVQS